MQGQAQHAMHEYYHDLLTTSYSSYYKPHKIYRTKVARSKVMINSIRPIVEKRRRKISLGNANKS